MMKKYKKKKDMFYKREGRLHIRFLMVKTPV